MLQLSTYAPPQALKANHSQRVGNTETELEELCALISRQYEEYSQNLKKMNDGVVELIQLIKKLKNLDCKNKDTRVGTLRIALKNLYGYGGGYNSDLSV